MKIYECNYQVTFSKAVTLIIIIAILCNFRLGRLLAKEAQVSLLLFTINAFSLFCYSVFETLGIQCL